MLYRDYSAVAFHVLGDNKKKDKDYFSLLLILNRENKLLQKLYVFNFAFHFMSNTFSYKYLKENRLETK